MSRRSDSAIRVEVLALSISRQLFFLPVEVIPNRHFARKKFLIIFFPGPRRTQTGRYAWLGDFLLCCCGCQNQSIGTTLLCGNFLFSMMSARPSQIHCNFQVL